MDKNSRKAGFLKYMVNYKRILQYETIIIFGALIAVFACTNVIGLTHINSDLFWMFAGIGLMIDGFLEYLKWKQKQKLLLEQDKKLLKRKKDRIYY